MPEIEFGQRDVANSVRERLDGFRADSDDRRSKTVELKDAVPDEMVQRVREEAADSRQAEAEQGGQVELSDRERKQIDFSREGVNVPFARSVKGIADNEGVTDWLQFADLELSVDENRRVLKDASREERGRSGLGKSQEKRNIARAADNKQKRRQQAEGAKQPALEGDTNAAEFLREEQQFSGDLFDINLRSDGSPTGRDYERLEKAHESRPERAQRVDERRSAEVTRDPLKWAQNKSKFDYPGIDTVEPAELHAERSRKARRVDEEEQAPIADSRQQWALNSDQYDWPGVDTKQRPSMDDIKDKAQETMFARNDVLVEANQGGNEGMQESAVFGRAQSADVSLTPEEVMGDAMTDSIETTRTDPDAGMNAGFADVPEAMDAFAAAEEERGSSGGGVVGDLVDDRDQQASLDVGMDAGATRDRSGSVAGSANFADERDALRPDTDAGEQAGLLEETTNVGGDGQADLFGETATETSGQEYLK